MTEDAKKVAALHTAVIEKMVVNFDQLAKTVQDSRGYWLGMTATDVMVVMAKSGVYHGEEQDAVELAVKVAQRGFKFDPEQALIINAIETALARAVSLDAQIQALKEMIAVAKEGTALAFGLQCGVNFIQEGQKTIYNPDFLNQHAPKMPPRDEGRNNATAQWSWDDTKAVAADDAAGGVIGGLAGAAGTIWTTVGVGAGAAAGATSTGIVFSGKAIWDRIKPIWGPPIIHGPNDPNGPIGGTPPDEIPRD